MAQVTETQTFYLKGWPGGYNAEDYEHLRQADEFDACDYVLGPRGEALVRAGLDRLAAFNSWGGEARLAFLYPFSPDAGTHRYLVGVDLNGKVWRTGDGPAGPIVACNVTGPTQINLGVPPVTPACAVLGGYVILACEDDDPHYWDGNAALWTKITDHTLDDSGTEGGTWEMPVASTVCSGWSRLWAAGNDTYPSRLFWSGAMGTLKEGTEDAAGPWNWPSTNWVDINPEDGGEITRIFPFGQAIMVFKNNSAYAFVGAGDPTTARLYPIHGNIGCTLPGTVAESTGKLFWATDDGVYQYDGSGVTRIDGKVRSLMASHAGGTYSKWASGYAISERYHLHFPTAVQYGVEAYHYVYDTELGSWEWRTDGGWGSALFSDAEYVTRWGGIYLVGGNGPYDDITSQAGADSVTTPSSYLKTSWLPPPEQRSLSQYRVRRLDLYCERPAVSGAAPCQYRVSIYTDWNETTRAVGYLLDIDQLEKNAEAFTVTLPGYAGLVDGFRIVVEPVPASPDTAGNERIGLNGMSVLMSERARKRGPRAILQAGVSRVP